MSYPAAGRIYRKQLRAGSTDIALPAGQPKWRHEDRRIRPGFELEQYRAFFGPQRLRLIRAIRWLYRARWTASKQ